MNQVECEVVLHRNVECLHFFGLPSALGDGSVNLILSSHEGIVLCLDFVDNVRCVDNGFMSGPVNFLHILLRLRQVVKVENRTHLRMHFTGLRSLCGGTKSPHPTVSKLLGACGLECATLE